MSIRSTFRKRIPKNEKIPYGLITKETLSKTVPFARSRKLFRLQISRSIELWEREILYSFFRIFLELCFPYFILSHLKSMR
ncbi:hypothetical protein DLM75_05495 [Leptospira stimsonii]|uniref:Uncharacterized protein n=1 Tax=Leptospira stimsonii TaxID=2202203 RepID=A0A396ZFF4_9LEPT|nr:hypothetical protein DLM75_05495 [Leptospira stimsonii]